MAWTEELPEGFDGLSRAGWRIAVRSPVRAALDGACGGDPEALAAEGEARYEGRGRPVLVLLPGGTRGVLRRYLHGGALRGLTGARFLGPSRPFGELRAAERARRAGVGAPEVLAAWHRRIAGVFHEGWILTREVEGAIDLVGALRRGTFRRGIFADVGREVRRMHDAGVLHGDLHVKNVLVREGGVTILDFDRARILDPVPPELRAANLLRFDRSVEKLRRRGPAVPRTERLRLFAAYHREGLPRSDRDDLARRCRRSLAFHRLAWRLLGGGS